MRRIFALVAGLSMFLSGCGGTSAADAVSTDMPQLTLRDTVVVGETERNAGDPYLTVSQDGQVFMSWSQDTSLSEGHNSRELLVAAVDPETYQVGNPRRANNDRGISSHGGENLSKFTLGLDESITAIMPVMAEDDMHAGDLVYARAKKGDLFSPTVKLNDDGVVANHGFTSIATAPDGRIFVSWVDGRNDLVQSEVFMAVSEDNGRTFGENFKIGEQACNCCRPNIVFLDEGRTVVVSYRFVDEYNVRNHVVVHSTDGGKTFNAPTFISNDGWVSHGCPHAGISMVVDKSEVIHAVWWTGGRTKDEAGIYYTFSADGGKNFAPRQLIDKAHDSIVMHTYVTSDTKGNIYAAWVGLTDDKPDIFLAYRGSGKSKWSTIQRVKQDTAWYGFYPILAADADNLYMAWLERKGEEMRIQLRTAALAGS